MTWEETIQSIRKDPDFRDLVRLAYLDEDLRLNVERFMKSDEWRETVELIDNYKTGKFRVLDVGCGNGIASVAFALRGHDVVAVDPDVSETVGTGAVALLKSQFNLTNLEVITGFAEDVELDHGSFDLVYCRQSMHHANELSKFIGNCSEFLKPGGLLLTVRDHVVWGKKDKELFLKTHPLHRFYGGENAFSPSEYTLAFESAGLKVLKCLRHFDSVINYFPVTAEQIYQWKFKEPENIKHNLKRRLGLFGALDITFWLYTRFVSNPADLTDETLVPGRMYSYLTVKK